MTVRLRFAPSPTGHLHLGNARSAIMNALFAAQHGGWMLLRFDNTDQQRSLPEYEQSISEDLDWLGIKYHAVIHQAQRRAYYQDAMQKLIESGRLYPCYETPQELEAKRRRQLTARTPPVYDRAALRLSHRERKDLEDAGIQPHWRFMLCDEKVEWNDLIKGSLHYQANRISDPVLVRTDGAFLYTFTSVVDDIDLGMTHIIRGEDHVTNTAVQIQIWNALSASAPPQWAHYALLLDKDGKPLSKRVGSLGLKKLRHLGVEPAALVSWQTRLGTPYPFEGYVNVEEAAQHFDIKSFGLASPRLDEQDMWTVNHKVLTRLPFKELKPRLPKGAKQKLWSLVVPHLRKLEDFSTWHVYRAPQLPAEDKALMETALSCMPRVWNEQTWQVWMDAVKECSPRRGGALFQPLRLVLTGHDKGPEMPVWLLYCGPKEVKRRLQQAIHVSTGFFQ